MAATAVGAGILISRLAGLVRVSLFANYLGQQTIEADAFTAAFRIPNLLQNLFGEGALSGAFIPIHSALRARGEERAAAQAARTFFALLTLVVSTIVLIGILATPWIIPALAPGFTGAKRDLTIRLVRILFPGAGLLVASAWCLAVLNSHRKFLLSYTAPVAWNAAMIGCLLRFGGHTALDTLAVYLAWASVIGSFLQFAVQAPLAFALSRHDGSMALTDPVRQAVRNFFPVLISRGAVQLNGYIDAMIASLLPTGAVAAISNAQLIYTLPVSLFGVSISAAELPAMSGDAATGDGYGALRSRLESALRRLAFFVVPSAVAFAALGDVIAGALLQRGRFTPEDAQIVWMILAGSSAGLLASTMGRLYAVAHYAIGDTKRPLRIALVRLACSSALGYAIAVVVPPRLGLDRMWGAAGLALSSGLVGWLEFILLRRSLNERIGRTGVRAGYATRLWTAAVAGAAIGYSVKLLLPPLDPILRGALVLPAFGVVYLGMAFAMRVPMPGLGRGPGRV
ncbi:MAG TPA: murein biosynthesis integral membrane protein MurJ [Vicinamibacterales bacterium]|nr:murein biosynthesis integral membrane protein MurJ [Vicinamibacterales bacterium]